MGGGSWDAKQTAAFEVEDGNRKAGGEGDLELGAWASAAAACCGQGVAIANI